MQIDVTGKSIILVDYFDTLVFRCVRPNDVLIQWANVLKQKFVELKGLSAESIVNVRAKIKYEKRNDFDEVPYRVIINNLKKEFGINCSDEEFYKLNLEIEESLEMAVQYCNNDMVEWLKKQKKLGKKIYIVSDYYLPLCSYKHFLKYLNIDSIFDGVYASEELNATKRRSGAKLYQYVLDDLCVKKESVVMIGDNCDSDIQMTKKINLTSILYKGKSKKYINCFRDDFYKRFISLKLKQWRQSFYMEYAYLLYIFVERLFDECIKDRVRFLSFLSRDGYFLKTVFDKYQDIFVSDAKRITTLYCYNSRFVNQEAKLNKEVRDNYIEYMSNFIDDGYINVVDCGWNNSSQEAIQEIMNIKTRGYYVGTFTKNVNFNCKRLGLIYDIGSDGRVSDYYWLLRTNFTLIEQIMGAPHGSVIGFENKKAILEWPKKEMFVYKRWIKDVQKNLFNEFLYLAVWIKDKNAVDYGLLAKINVKSGLFANKKRLKFVLELSNNYYDNFSSGNNISGNTAFKKTKLSLKDKMFFPEKKLSVLVKRQRNIKTKLGMIFYKIWAKCFYLKLVLLGKFRSKKTKKTQKNIFSC